MHPLPTDPQPFDPRTAAPDELAALHAFTSRMRRELLPDDPLTPLPEAIAVWRANEQAARISTWLVRAGGDRAVIARGQVYFTPGGGNLHLASGSVEVLPEWRRRGIARALLARIAAVLRTEQRPVLIASTMAHAPGGAAWMERLGAERGLETTVRQLRLEALDRGQLGAWLAREGGEAFELGFWDGPYPEAELEAIAGLHEVMGSQPTGTLDVRPERVTGEQLRQVEAAMAARGRRRWSAYARERATGRFAGFTELSWLPRAPELLHQGNTGVWPEFRGRGLGARLKAAMLDRVLRERPEARFVRTSNADVNAAMIGINRALGFEPYFRQTVWQARLESIEAWLGAGTPC